MTELAVAAAKAAADVIMDVYSRPFEAVQKQDGSPVTEADGRAEAVIVDHLKATGIPVLGEESVAAGIIPDLGDRYFIVDPLDGTREFIKRNGEFTVNIALVENGVPVLGVVLVPVTGEIFVGDEGGAFQWEATDGVKTRRRLEVSEGPSLRIVASRSHGHAALEALCTRLAVTEDISVGSSLKFCLLAEGKAALYPRLTPTCEWDTAAGQAVLEAAGGVVVTLDGRRLRYGKTGHDYLNPFFVGASSMRLAQRAAGEIRQILQVDQSHASSS